MSNVAYGTKEWYDLVDRKKKEYPAGTRVVLDGPLRDEPRKIPVGMKGIVHYVDDTGTVFVKWDDGSYLGLIVEDNYHKVV